METPELEWVVRSGSEARPKVVAIFLLAVIVLLAGGVFWRSWLLGFAGFAMMLGSTAEFWLGVHYRVDARGAARRVGPSLTLIRWSDVKRIVVGEQAIRLSPFDRPHRMDAFRGVVLQAPAELREQVRAAVKHYMGDDHGHVGD